MTCPATWKNHQGEHGQNTGMRGEFEPQPICKVGRINSLELASLNNFGRL